MSLLDLSGQYQPCNVYMEVRDTDEDGNIRTRASDTPIPAVARFQIESQSGTSARDLETDKEGYSTEEFYRVRFPRAWHAAYGEIGAQGKIGWGLDSLGREKLYSIFGNAIKHSGSRNTARLTYVVRRV